MGESYLGLDQFGDRGEPGGLELSDEDAGAVIATLQEIGSHGKGIYLVVADWLRAELSRRRKENR